MARPKMWTSPAKLQTDIDTYFESIKWNIQLDRLERMPVNEDSDKRIAAHNKKKPKGHDTEDRHPTVSGLAVSLNTNRQTLVNYSDEDKADAKFVDTIKKAKSRIEAYAEQRLSQGHNVAGIIFSLKNNYSWADKTETEAEVKMIHEYVEESV